MTPKPQRCERIGDQVLLLPKPEIWRCHYEKCSFAVVVLRRALTPQMVADHILHVHYEGEGPQ